MNVTLNIKLSAYIIVITVIVSVFSQRTLAQAAYEDLLHAVNAGDDAVVRQFLARGLDVNTTDLRGDTILMIAARAGHHRLVSTLIAAKADLDRRTPVGDTAVMLASLKGHLPVVTTLVEAGASLRSDGWTALHYAAFGGHGRLIRYLLGRGSDRDGVAPNGYTALMLAARGGHVEAVQALLYEDAQLNLRSPDGQTALGMAREKGMKGVEDLLVRSGAVE